MMNETIKHMFFSGRPSNLLQFRSQWLWVMLLLVAIPATGQSKKISKDSALIKLEQIRIDESGNALRISFSTLDSALMNRVASQQVRLQLNIQKGSQTFNDVAIKKEERLSANKMQLIVQPPLSDAIYRTEKRIFTLQIIAEDSVIYERSSATILGAATKPLDLRPYAKIDRFGLFMAAAIGVAIMTLLLLMVTPLYQRFRFKKHHVKRYSTIEVEGKPHKDPFTFVIIDDDDDVVVYDNRVMLLSSWKTLRKLPESKLALENEMFFEENLAGSYFYPNTDSLKKINRAWFGMVGILIGWIGYLLIMSTELGYYYGLLSHVFDNGERLISNVIARETILGLTLGLGSGLALAIGHQLYTKDRSSLQRIAISAILKTLLISLAFILQALVTVYLIQNSYGASLCAWLLIGISFAFPSDFKTGLKRRIFQGLVSGILAFGVFQVLTSKYFANIVYVDLAMLCGLVIIALSVHLISVKIGESKVFKALRLDLFKNLRNMEGGLSTFKLSKVKSRVRAIFLMAGKSSGIDQKSDQTM